jgi:hypothetical protein
MRSYIKSILLLCIIISICTTSCLKDEDFDNGSIQSVHSNGGVPNVVEIGLTATNTSNFLVLAVDNSASDTTINLVPINVLPYGAAQDIHVTVDLDSTLVNEYNAANGTAYSVPTSDMFTIVNPVVTIPKDSTTGYVQIKFNPSAFLGGSWALGFRISSVQEPGYNISANLKTGIANIAVKNQYDGIYNAVGHFDHPVYAGDYNTEWTLATSGPTSVDFQLDVTVLFGVIITLTVNNDNSVTISSDYVVLDPYDAAKNYYDPATKTFHLDFSYSGGTRRLVGTATFEHSR